MESPLQPMAGTVTDTLVPAAFACNPGLPRLSESTVQLKLSLDEYEPSVAVTVTLYGLLGIVVKLPDNTLPVKLNAPDGSPVTL